MLVQALLGELQHEAENTRKLFDAITDDVLDYKPNDFNWTIGQLASHISETYFWWESTLNQDVFDIATHKYDKGDITSIESIKKKLNENIDIALNLLKDYPEEKLMQMWSMKNGAEDLMAPMPRIQVIRAFLMSHLYHHRGEMIAYLRVNKKQVPGLYGPAYEEQQQMMAQN